MARGVRRPRSRFGGRLEPLFRVDLVLHEGRGEVCAVNPASTGSPHPHLRDSREPLQRATQACDAVLKLFDSQEPNRPAYNLLCNELQLLDEHPEAATRAQALSFRLKLLLAAGFMPELAACASCGEREHLRAFSASAGGVVCPGCEAGPLPPSAGAHPVLGEGPRPPPPGPPA